MTRLSRRRFVAGSAAGIGAAALPSFPSEAQTVVTRSNLASPNGQINLRKYARAVGLMKARPTRDPLSWNFQWFTHAVPSNTTKAAAINAAFGPAPSPAKTLANLMWNTCQAHFNPVDEQFFLPWHRMYVCFLESIIRRVLNDATFALPYWNYSVPSGFALPAQFRMQGDPVFGPLFEPKRRAQVNAGQPIFAGIGTASDLSPAASLAQANYLPSGVNPGFNQHLDQNLHGNVHVFVGGNQNMGSVPFAAGDPIFWMHHCNIDRLWVTWNQNHANPNNAPFVNKSFVFAGQNGQRLNAVVRDFRTPARCGYRYDQLAAPAPLVVAAPPIPSPTTAAAGPVQPVTVATPAAAGAVTLGTGPARVDLRATETPSVAAGAPGGAAAPLAARVEALPANRRIYLVLRNLSAAMSPEAIYRVYLDLPEGASDDPLNSHYVGSFNFFDAAAHGGDHSGASKPFSFDITALIANLQARGVLKSEHTVTIVPSGQPTEEARAVVGEIAIVEQ
jgi:tyrosinase